jgi:hypothetical protein
MRPVSQCAKVRHDSELYAYFARLKLGSGGFWGGPRCAGFPAAPPAQFEPGGQRFFLKEELVMRSDLVFGALSHVSNRYQLCQLASKATRKLHKPNTRLQDTTNEVLGRFQTTNPGSAAPVKASADQRVETRRAA